MPTNTTSTRKKVRRTPAVKKLAPQATAVDRAVDAVREKIKEGVYAPGQRLIEADLTTALGISRGPLREAIWRLAGEGLVKVEPNRGAIVRKLSREEILDIYRIREMLEGLAARLAAENIGEMRGRSRIQAARAETIKAAKAADPYTYMEANEAFHDLIVELSRNAELAALISQLRRSLFRLLFRRILSPDSMRTSVTDHKEIAKAIMDGQPAASERAMRKHIRQSRDTLMKLPESAFD